jgi:hypothetical protein
VFAFFFFFFWIACVFCLFCVVGHLLTCPVAALSTHGPEVLAILLASGASASILAASHGLSAKQAAMQAAMNDASLLASLDVFTAFESEVSLRGI